MGKAGVGKAAHRRREVGEDLAEEGGREARQRATDAGEGGVQLEHRGKLEADEGADASARTGADGALLEAKKLKKALLLQ